MFTINLEDGREAPSKARKKGAKRLEFLVDVYLDQTFPQFPWRLKQERDQANVLRNMLKKRDPRSNPANTGEHRNVFA